jgi:mono/diheme cytochrome c family protein
LALLLTSCEWFTSFKEQPKIKPWQAKFHGETVPFRGNPQLSVSIDGATVLAYGISRPEYPTVLPAVIDSMAGIPNPVVADDRSLRNGRMYFQINCAVCHGPGGAGDGVMLRYGVAAPSLLSDRAKGLTDGYIWGIIRDGRLSMPTYDRIESGDRWDVVNYVRGLQGRLARSVPTGPVGRPGETGRTLPGATASAPTRPAPYSSPASATAAEMKAGGDGNRAPGITNPPVPSGGRP